MMNRKNQKGQIIVFVLLSVISLSMLWLMLINIGKMVKDRIMMQNAADCAAQTAACIRARGLNMIGPLNASLGIPVFTLGLPKFVWWPTPLPYLPCDWGAKAAKQYIDGIKKIQGGINKAYGGGLAFQYARSVARRQEFNSRGEPTGADGILTTPGSFSLGLERNKGEIWYWGTVWGIIPGIGFGPIPVPPQFCGILERNADRWYEQSENFHKKKQIITAYKKSSPGYPFGKNFFNIKKMPEIYTVAASRPYNDIGPMFPEKGKRLGIYAASEYLPFLAGKGWDARLVPVGGLYQH